MRVDDGLYERDPGAYKAIRGREKATGRALPLPFQFLAAWVGVWVARHQIALLMLVETGG